MTDPLLFLAESRSLELREAARQSALARLATCCRTFADRPTVASVRRGVQNGAARLRARRPGAKAAVCCS